MCTLLSGLALMPYCILLALSSAVATGAAQPAVICTLYNKPCASFPPSHGGNEPAVSQVGLHMLRDKRVLVTAACCSIVTRAGLA
jgi:hypothetical protein